MRSLHLAVRFLLELCALAAFGVWGFTLAGGWLIRLVAGLGAPLLMAIVWGAVIAPKAARRLDDPWRTVLEVVIFGLASLALAVAGYTGPGIALAVVAAVSISLMFVFDQRGA